MEKLVLSAPGKVILHGEHAVVYGKKALAGSLNLRTFLLLEKTNTDTVKADLPDISLKLQWPIEQIAKSFQLKLCDIRNPSSPGDTLLLKLKQFSGLSDNDTDTKHLAVVAFLYLYSAITYTQNRDLPSLYVLVSSKLPTSAGLGSSAAYSTSLAAAFLLHMGYISPPSEHEHWSDTDLKLINDWAFQSERIIHGNPSGIDNSVSSYGGALCFQSGKITPLTRVPTLKILLFNTKVPRSTKCLVAGVRNKYDKYKAVLGAILESIEAISDQCEKVLQLIPDGNHIQQHYQSLQELVEMNQYLLCVLGVSHPSLQQICSVVASHGLQCKLTGAGGGGCAFTILPPDVSSDTVSAIMRGVTELGFDSWQTEIGGDGVTLHHDIHNITHDIPSDFSV